jgi:hypothetical protein
MRPRRIRNAALLAGAFVLALNLALYVSHGRRNPSPASWIDCNLFTRDAAAPQGQAPRAPAGPGRGHPLGCAAAPAGAIETVSDPYLMHAWTPARQQRRSAPPA